MGVAKAGTGAPEGDRSQGVTGTVINTMTPETDSTCFYLWAFARDWCLDKQVITTRLREGVSGVFFEDEVMLEAQQRGIEANPGYDFYNLNIDAGSMWTRRIVRRMIAAESGTDTTATASIGRRGRAMSAVTAAENARRRATAPDGTGPGRRGGRRASRGTASSPPRASWAAGSDGDAHGSDEPQAVGQGQGARRLRGRRARPAGRARARAAGRARPARGATSTSASTSTGAPTCGRTPSSGPGAYGSEIILGVQLARQSRGGSAFMHALRRGQEVSITQPLQNFPLNYGRPGLRAGRGRDRHHRAGRDGQGAQGARRGLPVRLRGAHAGR